MAEVQHLDVTTYRAFVAGQLSRAETSRVAAHLTECDACLALVDVLWQEQPISSALATSFHLDPDNASRRQRRLVNRIRRSNLTGDVVRLGLLGFARVTTALVRPFLGSGGSRQKEEKT